ncbi:hypothetical protein TSAR_014323 [Trichomalopsis sarcophagae]|uniref:Uncharacterized protein n=1 Tax=Trichomalopsis sarcophagae TaxID=543379 RepID=A0A232ERI2_9HYME|nr:hypothetical protein TSAR_014323 [Trichomalopsis sarcophagae]
MCVCVAYKFINSYNYCVKSVINAFKVTNDEVCTVTVNHQITHNHAKYMILKVDVCSFALRLVKLFRNKLPYQFLLNSHGSALHPEPYGFGGKNTARMNST